MLFLDGERLLPEYHPYDPERLAEFTLGGGLYQADDHHLLAPATLCGWVRNIGREGTDHALLTLEQLRDFRADMFTTVFIGNRTTKAIDGRMVTPRGYENKT